MLDAGGEVMIDSFRDLIVYQKAYKMSLDMHKLTMTFPKFEQNELANQLRRASKSVAMNIAEGFGRKSYSTLADFKRFMIIALGSNDEVRVQLDYCKDLGYMSQEQYVTYESSCQEIGKILTVMLKTWK